MRLIDLFESDEPVLEADLLANGDAELVYGGHSIEIIKINSLKAGQFYSAGTEWVFAKSKASFNQASKFCPIYFIRSLIPGVSKRIIFCGNSNAQLEGMLPKPTMPYMRAADNDCLLSHEYVSLLVHIPPFLLKLLITANPSWIRFLENPAIDIQLISVQKDGRNVQYIEYPTPMIQAAACSNDPDAINLICPNECIDRGLLKKYISFLDRSRREYLAAIEAEENKLTESYDPDDPNTWSDDDIFKKVVRCWNAGNGPRVAYKFLEKLPDISQELMERLLDYDGGLIGSLQLLFPDKMTEDLCKLAIESDPSTIYIIENPSITLQLFAVNCDWDAIKWIPNPSPMIQSAACRQNPSAINQILPIECIDINLLKKYSDAIEFPDLKQRYKDAMEAEENKLTESYAYDPNDTSTWSDDDFFKKIKIILLSSNGPYDQAKDFLAKIANISSSLMKRLVSHDGWLIEELQFLFPDKITDEIRELAIKNRPDSIGFIDNPSIPLQLLAVNLDGLSIGDIRAPSPMIQSAACRQNPDAINRISEKCRDPGLAEKYKDHIK